MMIICFSPRDGNLADITRAGSLHEFLLSLHQQYGSIASFWMGNTQIVSLASPQLIEANKKVFDRSSKICVLHFFLILDPHLISIEYLPGDILFIILLVFSCSMSRVFI